MDIESQRKGLKTAPQRRRNRNRPAKADPGNGSSPARKAPLLPNGSILWLTAVVGAAGIAILTTAALQWQNEDLALLGTLAALAFVAERFDISLFGG